MAKYIDAGNPRVFDPSQYGDYLHHRSPPVVDYDPHTQLTHPRFDTLWMDPSAIVIDPSAIVINIDGACRGNGTSNACAAYGVFFGSGSWYNVAGRLPRDEKQTNQNAELFAAKKALDAASSILHRDRTLRKIVLITDSSYLFKSMVDYIHNWLLNGFRDYRRKKVVNRRALLALNEYIELLEQGSDVQFWLVDRKYNGGADRLANSALNRYL